MADLPCPGVVVVWRGGPSHTTHRVPDQGIEIEDSRFEIVDSRLGRTHLEMTPRTRVWWHGRALAGRQALSRTAVLRTGDDTVMVVVDDVRPFEGVTPVRAGKLVIAGSLGPILRVLDEAANAEENVSIKGPVVVAHELARHYAGKLGTHAWFRPGGDQHLDHFLSTRRSVRTVVIELVRPLLEADVAALDTLLETDLRFVIVRTNNHFLEWLPPALSRDTLEIPALRFDELPTTIADLVAATVPGANIRADAIELLLNRAATLGEDRWTELLMRALGRATSTTLDAADFARVFP